MGVRAAVDVIACGSGGALRARSGAQFLHTQQITGLVAFRSRSRARTLVLTRASPPYPAAAAAAASPALLIPCKLFYRRRSPPSARQKFPKDNNQCCAGRAGCVGGPGGPAGRPPNERQAPERRAPLQIDMRALAVATALQEMCAH